MEASDSCKIQVTYYKMHKLKIGIGIVLGVFFTYLALRKVDFAQMWVSLNSANYWYLLLALPVIFLSHLLRALRWRYLLEPIQRVDIRSLFSSLIIGLMANVLVPAHLGEVLRAYALSKKRRITASTTFATIVMERIIDVFSLLVLMMFSIFIYPFPAWVKKSAFVMFVGSCGIFVFMIFLRKLWPSFQSILRFVLRPFPERLLSWSENALKQFTYGITPLKHWSDYIIVCILSIMIWACYTCVFFIGLHAFDFPETYHLPWSTSLILLVITTIGIVIPSSPGYVGTFHYVCQISLAMYNVPASPAISYATVMHAINFLPVLILGLVLSYYEGIYLPKISYQKLLNKSAPEIL